jgi:diaminopimelate decarboxylase
MTHTSDRLGLFPTSTTIQDDSLCVAGIKLADLAARYGTPLYVYDRQTMDSLAANYMAALRTSYPAASSITYAGKAFLCVAIAEWAAEHGFRVDCTGESEIQIALAANLRPESIIAHGVSKSPKDLEAAITYAGILVVDNPSELRALTELLRRGIAGTAPALWLRLNPGAPVHTHHVHTQTGQADSKFGMTPQEILEAASFARSSGITIDGIHLHQGSNFRDTSPLLAAIGLASELAKKIELPQAWHFCPGGGWGVAYHEQELPHPDVGEYVGVIARELLKRCRLQGLSLPTLHIEPGRSLVARAGVAVYRVGTVKRRTHRTWLVVDGGLADNPRHALYGSTYTCLPVRGLGREMTELAAIGGPYCEAGDVLIDDLAMPPIEEGELLAIPVSGAYHLSMSSNYNGALRPAAVWLDGGESRLIMRRETTEDVLERQLSISSPRHS